MKLPHVSTPGAATDVVPATRRYSRRLFFHVLKDFTIILLCIVAGFMALFLFAAMHDDLADLMRVHAESSQIARYFVLLLPQYLARLLPMSMLLAAVYVVVNLCRHNEMTAMRSSGLSLFQATLPILLASFVVAGVQAWVSESLAPQSRLAATALFARLTNDPSEVADLPTTSRYLAYRNREDRRDWLFRDFAVDGPCRGVLITQFGETGKVEWELRADSAEYLGVEGGWVFRKALYTIFDERGEFFAKRPQSFDELHTPSVALDLPILRENPQRLSLLSKLRIADTMSVPDIVRALREPESVISATTRRIMLSYLVYRLAFPWACVVAVLIGIPLSVTTERGTAMRSFVIAAGVMVLYYLSAEVFLVLGKSQVLPPVVAGGLPTLGFMIWGILAFRRKQ